MARKFVITSELILRGPSNLNQVVSSINKRLSNIKATVDLRIDQRTAKNLVNVNKQISNLNTLLAQTARNSGIARTSLQQLGQVFQSNQNAINVASSALKNAGNQASKTSQQFSQARTVIEDFGFKSGLAIKRFAAFSLPAGALLAFTTATKTGVKSAIDFQNEMVRLSQVTGKSLNGLQDISAEITRLGVGLGVSSTELSQVSVTLAQAGLSAKNTKIALEALAKTDVAPTFDNIQNTTEGAIAILQQFGLSANQLESTLSSLNSVAAAFAVESSDVVAAVRRTGGAFKAAGGNFNELISLFTSVRQTTRESAETIATGFRTIFTRLQRPQTIKFLQEFGIELKDLEGKFVGPYEAVLRLNQGLAGLDTRDLKFAQITEELGGFRQISKVIPLIQQASVAQRALSIAQAGTNSLARDAANAQQSYARQIAQVREEFVALFRTLASSDAFKKTLDILLGTASTLIKITEAASSAIPVLGALFAVKGVKALGQFSRGFGQQFGLFGGSSGGTNSSGSNQTVAAAKIQATAITSNTNALASLNNSIQRLIQSLAINPGGFASSRRPKKFATGGLVPGSGNTDSVLTALMPGEYVIRKSAVKKIGAENLAGINQLATGGLPDPRLEAKRIRAEKRQARTGRANSRNNITIGGPTDFAGFFFNPEGSDKQEYIDSLLGSSNLSVSNDTRNAIASQAGLNPEDINNVRIPLKRFYIGPDVRETFNRKVNTGIKLLIKNLVDSYGSLKGYPGIDGNDLEKISKSIPIDSIKGSLFEGFVSGVTRDFPVGDAQRTFDFEPGGKTRFAELFGSGADAIKYADAKLTDTKGSLDSLASKALTKAAIDKSISVRKYARGGAVPALVTPGEFVVNASAAQRLGSSKLGQLNRGNIPKFQTGGQLSISERKRLIRQLRQINPNQKASKTFAGQTQTQKNLLGFRAKTGIAPTNIGAVGGLVLAGSVPSLVSSTLGDQSKIGAGISGATTGAITGATLGSILGPFGAAAGGLIGGIVGLTSSITAQAEAIREAELTPVIEKLGETISAINQNQLIPGVGTSVELAEQIGKIRTEAGLQGQATLFESVKQSLGIDQTSQQVQRRENFLQSNINGAELLRAIQNISGQFSNTDAFFGAGSNTQLVKDAAELLGKSFSELKGEIDVQIQQRQKELLTLRGVEDFYNALSKLNIVQDVAGVFDELRFTTNNAVVTFSNLAAAAENTVVKFEAIDISDLFKRPTLVTGAAQDLARTNISDTLSPLGDAGKQLTESVLDLFEVKSLLPNILDKISNTALLDIEGTELADVFVSELRNADISQALKSQLGDVFRSIVGNSKDPEIQQDIKKNRDAFAARITDPFQGITDAFSNIAKARTDNINQLFDRIQKTVENSLKIEESKRSLGEQQIELLQFQNRNNKNFFLTSGQITAPFTESLQRLSGGRNAGQLRESILTGTQRQNELGTALNRNPDNKAAREELIKLQDSLTKDRAALTLLTQSVQEATKVQNELVRVEAKIEATQKETISAFDSIVFGSAEDRRGLTRAFGIAQNANRPGFLNNISPKVLGETIAVFEQFPELFGEDFGKEVRVTFLKSLEIPQNVKDKLIKGILDGPANLRAKANALEVEALKLRQQGIDALDVEIGLREEFNRQLKDTALTDFNNRTKELSDAFALLSKQILEQRLAEATGDLQTVQAQKQAAESLKNVVPGFNQFANPDAIRNFVNSAPAQQLITDVNRLNVLQNSVGRAIGPNNVNIKNILGESLEQVSVRGESLQNRLSQSGINNLLSELKITDIGSQLDEKTILSILNSDRLRSVVAGGSQQQIIDEINKLMLRALETSIKEQRGVVNKSRQRLIDSSGGRLNQAGVDSFIQNLGQINQLLEQVPAGENLERLGISIKQFTDSVNEAQEAINANRFGNKPGVDPRFGNLIPAEPFAGGGSIFKKRGTDTVPAMLTPGEFVINRKSTQANLPLIEKINEAKGPIYAAGGRLITDRDRSRETTADVYRKLSFFQRLKADTVGLRGDEVAEILGQQKSNEVLAKNKFPTLSDTEFTRAKQREEALRSGVPTEALYEDEKPQTKAEIIARARKDVLAYETEQSRIRGLDKEFLRRIETKPKSQTSGDFLPTLVDITRTGIQSAAYDRTLPFRDQAFNEKDRLGRTLGSGIDYIRSAGGSNTDSYFGDMSDAGFAARTNQDSRLFDTSTTEARILNTRLNTQRDADRYRAAKAVVDRANYEAREAQINAVRPTLSNEQRASNFEQIMKEDAARRAKLGLPTKAAEDALRQARIEARKAELDAVNTANKKEREVLDSAFGPDPNDPFSRRDRSNQAFEDAENAIALARSAQAKRDASIPTFNVGPNPNYTTPLSGVAVPSLSTEQQARIDAIKREQAVNARHEAAKTRVTPQELIDRNKEHTKTLAQAKQRFTESQNKQSILDEKRLRRNDFTRRALDLAGPDVAEKIRNRRQLASGNQTQKNKEDLFARDDRDVFSRFGIGSLLLPPISSGTNRRLYNRRLRSERAATFQASRNSVPTRATEEEIKRNILRRAQQRKLARGFADGGFVSGGVGFSDSVPAALSRGEFVLNRGATAKIGVPTLQRFNQGGQVQYKQYGGTIDKSGGNVMAADAMNKFVQSVSMFAGSADRLASALDGIKGIEISMKGTHKVEVIHNGAELFNQITPMIKELVVSETNTAIANSNKKLFTYSPVGPMS